MSHLTTVTLEVEVLVESHHSDRLLAARGRDDGLIAAHAQRGETPEIQRWKSGCQWMVLSHILTHSLTDSLNTFKPQILMDSTFSEPNQAALAILSNQMIASHS